MVGKWVVGTKFSCIITSGSKQLREEVRLGLLEKLRSLFKPEEKGAAQKAGERIDRATQQAGEKIERGVDKAGDKIIGAGKKLKDSVNS